MLSEGTRQLHLQERKKEDKSETSNRQELLMAGHYKDKIWCNFKVMGLISYEDHCNSQKKRYGDVAANV